MNSNSSAAIGKPSHNDYLGDQIAELAAHIHAATYRFLVMIREFDDCEAWAEMGSNSCAHWLNWRCGMSVHTAREKLRVAHALKELPQLSEAFERGRLSFSKVRAATRVATVENESVLLNIALSGTASQMERLVRTEIHCEREADIVTRTQKAFEERTFGWSRQADGSVEFFGRLPAELAEKLIAAIEASIEKATNDVPAGTLGSLINADQRTADNLGSPDQKITYNVENTNQKTTGSLGNAGRESTETRAPIAAPITTPITTPMASRRADALVALCESHCTGYEVTVHVPAGAAVQSNRLKHTGTIPKEAAERLCCDAAIIPVLEDERGNVLDIGRRSRSIPPAIRRALEIRDKGSCRFPGCNHTHFLHGHHIEHWAHGGKTCLDNLVLLCSKHHSLVHESGFGCKAVKRKNKAGVNVVFSTPGGVTIPEAFLLKPVDDQLEEQQQDSNINPYTCSATDADTPLDTNCVIDALARFKKP